jgi:ABC-type glycerol-3-phosphate transport system substrate-binding protein
MMSNRYAFMSTYKRISRKLVWLTAAFFLFTMQISCAHASNIVLTVHDPSGGGREGSWLREAAATFEAEHPGVKVELVDAGIWGASQEKIPVLAAGGVAPDVVFIYHEVLRPFANNGILADLTPYAERDREFIESFIPPAIEAGWFKGRLWSLPHYLRPAMANANNDFFSEAGLPSALQMYRSGDWNFYTMINIGKALTRRAADGTMDRAGLFFSATPDQSVSWVWGYGARLFSEDGTTIFTDDPNVLKGYQFMIDLRNTHEVANIDGTSGTVAGGLTGGRWGLALWHGLMYHVSDNWKLPYSYSFLPFPAGPASYVTGSTTIRSWGISEASPHKDLAWEFIKLFTGPQWDRLRMERGYELPMHYVNLRYTVDIFAKLGVDIALITQTLPTHFRPWHGPIEASAINKVNSALHSAINSTVPLTAALANVNRDASSK